MDLNGSNGPSRTSGAVEVATIEKPMKREGVNGETIPDWMSQWTNHHNKQHHQLVDPRIASKTNNGSGTSTPKRQSWYSTGGAPSTSPTTTTAMDLDVDDDDDDDTDSLVEVGVTRPSEEWESMLLDDRYYYDSHQTASGTGKINQGNKTSSLSTTNDDNDDDDEMMSCRSDLDYPVSAPPPIPTMIESAAVTGLDVPTPLPRPVSSSSWHLQRVDRDDFDDSSDEYVDVIMQLDEDEGLLPRGVTDDDDDDDLMMGSRHDYVDRAATSPPPPPSNESLYEHLDAYSMNDGFLFLDSHQTEEMMMMTSSTAHHTAPLAHTPSSSVAANSINRNSQAMAHLPKPPSPVSSSGATKKISEKKKKKPSSSKPKKKPAPKTISTSAPASTKPSSSSTAASKKSPPATPKVLPISASSKTSSTTASPKKSPPSKPTKKTSTTSTTSPTKKPGSSLKTTPKKPKCGAPAVPRPRTPTKPSTSSAKPSSAAASPPTSRSAAVAPAASSQSGSENPTDGMDERVFHETLQKLSDSMKRSKETRKSLTMTTPKVTDEYARRASVSKVLTSIEWSSRQVDTYMQNVQQRTNAL